MTMSIQNIEWCDRLVSYIILYTGITNCVNNKCKQIVG